VGTVRVAENVRCSIFVRMEVLSSLQFGAPPAWPRPPACLPHARLNDPPEGARIAVAGLVLVRQRPGTAKGVIFLTLEDETGVANVVVWKATYALYRRAVIAGRLLRVTGRIQRQNEVVHVVAEKVEDISPMLDLLLSDPTLSRGIETG